MKLSYGDINFYDRINFETDDLFDSIRDFGYGLMEVHSGELESILLELFKTKKELEVSKILVELSQISCGNEGDKIKVLKQTIDRLHKENGDLREAARNESQLLGEALAKKETI